MSKELQHDNLDYENIDEIINIIESRPHPLACYIFSSNKENIKKLQQNVAMAEDA